MSDKLLRVNEVAEILNNPETPNVIEDDEDEAQTEAEVQVQTLIHKYH
jgi:hypothetical protein